MAEMELDDEVTKTEWVLLALQVAPLDRLRLMKTLFLVWLAHKRSIPSYFEFEPYLYGPCSFELYDVLADLTRKGYVSQAPHVVTRWSPYFLTTQGAEAAARAARKLSHKQRQVVAESANFAARASFRKLLDRVYELAPEFAVNSIAKSD